MTVSTENEKMKLPLALANPTKHLWPGRVLQTLLRGIVSDTDRAQWEVSGWPGELLLLLLRFLKGVSFSVETVIH